MLELDSPEDGFLLPVSLELGLLELDELSELGLLLLELLEFGLLELDELSELGLLLLELLEFGLLVLELLEEVFPLLGLLVELEFDPVLGLLVEFDPVFELLDAEVSVLLLPKPPFSPFDGLLVLFDVLLVGFFVVLVLLPVFDVGLLGAVTVFDGLLVLPVEVFVTGLLLLVTLLPVPLEDELEEVDDPLFDVIIFPELELLDPLEGFDVVPLGLLEVLDPPTGLFVDVVPPGLLEVLDPPTGFSVELLELLDPLEGFEVEVGFLTGFLRPGFLKLGSLNLSA